jgi:hypothetical protein
VKTVTAVIGVSAFSCAVLAVVPVSVMVTAFHWRATTLNKTGAGGVGCGSCAGRPAAREISSGFPEDLHERADQVHPR